ADQPRSVWVSHLIVHLVEALVQAHSSPPLEPLSALVLKALGLRSSTDLHSVDARLHFGVPVLSQIMRGLQLVGLVNETDGKWTLTDRGRQALATGQLRRHQQERRRFPFLQTSHPEMPFHFLSAALPASMPWSGPPELAFDVAA